MNFDRLAGYYPWLEACLAGSLMQKARTAFLVRTEGRREALLVGEGPGKFMGELLRFNHEIRIVYVDNSRKMIEQAQRKLQRDRLDLSRVEFREVDIHELNLLPAKFDLVVTNFFLDCFRPDQLQKVVSTIAKSAKPEALWLLADFRVPTGQPARFRAQVILWLLYRFFEICTSLSAKSLTPPDRYLEQEGFSLKELRLASFGLVHSTVWQRN